MAKKINGRSLLIIAAGICMWFTGSPQLVKSAQAAYEQAAKTKDTEAGKPIAVKKLAKHSSRSWKKHASAQRKLKKIAAKSSQPKMLAILKMDDGDTLAALPADVANANARLASDDTPAASGKVMSVRADAVTQTAPQPNAATDQMSDTVDSRLVSADQLNDVDRALTENKAPVPLLAMAAASTSPMINARIMASTEDNAWAKSSIVGKIFIAFGGLLTLASAARMFMA
jgi:hypothetical protein